MNSRFDNSIGTLRRLTLVLLCFLGAASWADHGGGSHFDANLSVPATSSTGNYTVTWTNNSCCDETQYLQEKPDGGSYTDVYSGSGGSKSITGKDNGTYDYRVAWEICFYGCTYTYTLPESIVVSIPSAPGTPGDIEGPISAADGGSGASYTLSWTAASGTVDDYELELYGSNGWENIQTSSSSVKNKLESGQSPGAYLYRVRACNSTACGLYTPVKTVSVMYNNITSAPSTVTADAVGTMPYTIDVATDGDALINVPLRLIPGVAGFAPKLSLEYDSGRGIDRLEQSLPEDTIGYGWRLTGLSQIRRCVVNKSSTATIDLDNGDGLCLDGMRLRLISGSDFSVGATYRTKVESFTHFEIKGEAGDIWIEATQADGTIVEYGSSTDSRVNYDDGVDYQWSIKKATSADGNVIDYEYFNDPVMGINYITRINYTNANVIFEYQTRNDTQAVMIDTVSQIQSALLHTVRVTFTDSSTTMKVREYRLVDFEDSSGRLRLNKIQLCGFDEYDASGSTISCLTPLDPNWMVPSSTMDGVEILVDEVIDGLGAVHQFEYGTITGSSHSFLFTERPFGNGTPPTNGELLSGGGALRHVATKLRRDNGLGGFFDTSYAYQNVGLVSTKHRGFLGFYAQRITDEQSGIVSYAQYRVNYPHIGQLARLLRFDAEFGSHTQTLNRVEIAYGNEITYYGSANTYHPYIESQIDFHYEASTLLGASLTENELTFVNGFVDKIDTTLQVGTGVSEGSSGSNWGDIPPFTLSGIKHTTENSTEFTNRSSGGSWLIGFASSITNESWAGIASGSGIVQDATLSPHPTSLRPEEIEQFPNHASLTLTTELAYLGGLITGIDVSGDSIDPRHTDTVGVFKHGRYSDQKTNDLGHVTTFSDYDVRFGTVEVRGSAGNGTTWVRDPFGRVISHTNSDGVVTTTEYKDCTSCSNAYGIAPTFYTKTTTTRSGTTIAANRYTYHDSLGRVIKTSNNSFEGTPSSIQKFKYDSRGDLFKFSMPYFSGDTVYSVVRTFDLRGRLIDVARPDGSNKTKTYSAGVSTVIEAITENVKKADGSSDGSQVKQNEYNILGQLVKTTDGHGTNDSVSTTYTFDANGHVLTATVDGGAAGTTTTNYEYDDAGNQTKIIGPSIGTVVSTYTALNQLKTITDNKNQLSSFEYDTLGRATSLVNIDGTSTWIWDSATNGEGKLKSKSLGTDFVETYSYNSNGKLEDIVTALVPIGGGSTQSYTTSHTYDSHGRLKTTTYPGSDFVLTRVYDSRGFLTKLKDGATALQTFIDMDAFRNSAKESYGNGVVTYRTADPKTGRLTDIDTSNGGTVFQDNQYDWRSNGTLESRIANPVTGIITTRKESFSYDILNRIEQAKSFVDSVNTRDLDYSYDELGNILSKTSTLSGDTDVTGYLYGAGSAGPHAVTSASVDGVLQTLTYDENGAITKYNISGTSDDKYISYNAYNQPTKLIIGDGWNDTTPVAADRFAYGPGGNRYYRETTWQESGTRIEKVVYVGDVEIVTDNIADDIDTIYKTRISANVMHIKVEGTELVGGNPVPRTEEFFEYAHTDHLGSVEVVTDDNGAKLDDLAFEPYGSRKNKDWSGNIASGDLDDLLDRGWNQSPKVRGFTWHEHIDRSGFIHMNGRVYDPTIGRFLSPDPIVQFPHHSESWNRYSYILNAPTSGIDPTGFSYEDPAQNPLGGLDSLWGLRDFAGNGYSTGFGIGGGLSAIGEGILGGGNKEANSGSDLPEDGLTSSEARIVFQNVWPKGIGKYDDINDILPNDPLPEPYLDLAEEMLVQIANAETPIDIIGNTAVSGVRGLAQASLKVFVKQTVQKIFKEAINSRGQREKLLENFFKGVSPSARFGVAQQSKSTLELLLSGA